MNLIDQEKEQRRLEDSAEKLDLTMSLTNSENELEEERFLVREPPWWSYMARERNLELAEITPSLKECYTIFSKDLEVDSQLPWKLVKGDEYVKVYRTRSTDQGKKLLKYKATFVLDDFEKFLKLMRTDLFNPRWNEQVVSIEQRYRLADNSGIYSVMYSHNYGSLQVNFVDDYMTEYWITQSNFFYLRKSTQDKKALDALTKRVDNLLCFPLEIESYGVSAKNIYDEIQKTFVKVFISIKEPSMFKRPFVDHFIVSLLMSHAIIKNNLDIIYDKINEFDAHYEEIEDEYAFKEEIRDKQEDNGQTFSRYNALNQAQRKSFHSFKRQVLRKFPKEAIINDNLLCRFLESKEFDMKKSLELLEAFIKWRKDSKIDELRPKDFDKFERAAFVKLIGEDREGRPLIYLRGSLYYPDQTPDEEFIKYFACFIEQTIRMSQRSTDTYTIIVDLNNMKTQNFKVSQLKNFLKMMMDYYPSHLYKLFIANSTSLFKTIYYVVRPILPDITASKIIVLPSRREEMLVELEKFIDPLIIPVALGGKQIVV
eukprot:TRINITY_DN618_c0_g1_i19.p1 TRINITY_DN618_c0_g1~~TRINITY_DN618_c0_g1_i19.p1  ORF type:complete len:541 (-),score=119.39 TRINITY_DN618_c0_g1_i19:91-1713(-)